MDLMSWKNKQLIKVGVKNQINSWLIIIQQRKYDPIILNRIGGDR